MVFIEFSKFYRKTKDRFDEKHFDKDVLYDIYSSSLTDLIYDEKEERFYDLNNNRKYVFDEEKLCFYPKIDELYPNSYEIKDCDMFVEFDSANNFRITKVNNEDLIVLGGYASKHVKKILDSPLSVDYKYLYYMVFPNVVSKLKKVKKYDEDGEIIPVTVRNVCDFLQYIPEVNNIFKIEIEGNSIESNQNLRTLKNYTRYLEEVEKYNYAVATIDYDKLELNDLDRVELDYREGFTQEIILAKKCYNDMKKSKIK